MKISLTLFARNGSANRSVMTGKSQQHIGDLRMGSLRQFASIVEKISDNYQRYGAAPEPHRLAGSRDYRAPRWHEPGSR
jgi:hypothetical protein